jgi:hypothetical protein
MPQSPDVLEGKGCRLCDASVTVGKKVGRASRRAMTYSQEIAFRLDWSLALPLPSVTDALPGYAALQPWMGRARLSSRDPVSWEEVAARQGLHLCPARRARSARPTSQGWQIIRFSTRAVGIGTESSGAYPRPSVVLTRIFDVPHEMPTVRSADLQSASRSR